MKRPYPEILLHIIFWSLCYWIFLISFSFHFVQKMETDGGTELIQQTIYQFDSIFATLLSFMFVVYININLILPQFLREKKVWKYSLQVLALVGGALIFKFALLFVFQLIFPEPISQEFPVSYSLLIFLQFFFLGPFLRLCFRQKISEKRTIEATVDTG